MTPHQLRIAGETIVSLSGPLPRDWRDALAESLGVPRAEIDGYAGAARMPRELDGRITAVLQKLGREMCEPGRLSGH